MAVSYKYRTALGAGLLVLATAGSALATSVSLSLTGGDDDLKSALNGALSTRSVLDEDGSSAQDVAAAARADYPRLVAALYDHGYYAPSISIRLDGREAAAFGAFDTPASIDEITVTVAAGPRYVFGKTRVAPLPDGVSPPEALTSGRVAELQRIKEGAQGAVGAWRDLGHAKAAVTGQSIVADHPNSEIDVDLAVTPGPRVRFGELQVTGLDRLRPARAKAIAGLPTGEVFSPGELDRSAERLRQTGVFNIVSLTEAESLGPDQTMDIEAELIERKPRRFGFGAEYDTVEGARLSTFWMHRNLFGGAERFRLEGEVSGIDQDLDGIDYAVEASLSRPATFHPDLTLNTTIGYTFTDDPAYRGDRLEAEVTLDRWVSEAFKYSYGIGFVGSRFTDSFGTRDFRLVTFPVTATLDKRDDSLNATEGYYIQAEGIPFTSLEGTDDGIRLSTDMRGYYGLGAENRAVLAGRLQLGSLVGPLIANAPPDYLFLSGGGGTVRGQPYQSLGVTAPGGGLTGGRNFIGLSGELRVKASDAFSVVAFYDTGFVGDSPVPGENGSWHSGTGLGLRYNTGLGPLRVDVATPASGGDAFDGVSFYVGLGQSF
jgi:translocation and assembly module TamA